MRWMATIAGMGVAICAARAEVRPVEVNYPVRLEGFGFGYGENTTQYWAEIGSFFGSDDLKNSRVSVSPLLHLFSPLFKNEVELSWGFIQHSLDPDVGKSRSTFRMGNPFLAHYWTWRSLEQQVRLGLGATVPAAFLRERNPIDTAVDLDAYGRAAGMRGWHDLWLWFPEHTSVVLHADYLHRDSSGFVFGGELKLGEMFGIGEKALGNDDPETVVEVSGIAQYETNLARFSLRASYVTIVTKYAEDLGGTRDDDDQIAAELGARWRLGPVDLISRVTVPIDKPMGFGAEEGVGQTWGVHLGFASPTKLRLPEAK